MSITQTIGTWGENIAAEYLIRKGYTIKQRNFHSRFGEVDIIAQNSDKCFIFVEVKTRKNNAYGRPSEFVNTSKQQKLKKTALIYTGTDNIDMRFDIIEILYIIKENKPSPIEINHIENAF